MWFANNKWRKSRTDSDRLRKLFARRLEFAGQHVLAQSATAKELEKVGQLGALLALRREERLRSLGARAPLIASFLASVLLFAGLASSTMPRTDIGMEAIASSFAFSLPPAPDDVLLMANLQISGLKATGLSNLEALFLTNRTEEVSASELIVRPQKGFESEPNVTIGEFRVPAGSDIALNIDDEGNLQLAIDSHGKRIELECSVSNNIVAASDTSQGWIPARAPTGASTRIGLTSAGRIKLEFSSKGRIDFSTTPAADLKFVRTDLSLRPEGKVPTQASSLISAKVSLRALSKEFSVHDDALGVVGAKGLIKFLGVRDPDPFTNSVSATPKVIVLRFEGTIREMRIGDFDCAVSASRDKPRLWERFESWLRGDAPGCRSVAPSRLEYVTANSPIIAVWTGAACLIAFFLSVLKWMGLEK